MAIAYTDRCTATSWKGKPGDSLAAKGRCIYHDQSRQPHERHRDEHGNNFITDDDGAHIVDAHGRRLS